jgi:hypothetical protein
MTDTTTSVHDLQKTLETARLSVVEELAAKPGTPAAESLQRLATLQLALAAVREAIVEHQGKLGWGPAPPLE